MRSIEVLAFIVILTLLATFSLQFYSTYHKQSTYKINAEAMMSVKEAVRLSSLYHEGDIAYWQDYLTGSGWKHALCQSDIPTDCWEVKYSDTASDFAVVNMIADGNILDTAIVPLFTKPTPFAIDDTLQPLFTSITPSLTTANYITADYPYATGEEIGEYVVYRKTP